MLGRLGGDLGEELVELNGAVPPVLCADDRAIGGVERREQAGGAVPEVVMGAFLWHAGHHRSATMS